ncbi:hypothetical protein E2C01_055577 [Portunus trituberculatus]|uniref:Uncharacterized protein n=1 Tax=Portunus trituberculatus TaxID=210409 RepID=A0A5B7GV56_PORTR|nr:hypothetical protein [Portunus trituberculatus]
MLLFTNEDVWRRIVVARRTQRTARSTATGAVTRYFLPTSATPLRLPLALPPTRSQMAKRSPCTPKDLSTATSTHARRLRKIRYNTILTIKQVFVQQHRDHFKKPRFIDTIPGNRVGHEVTSRRFTSLVEPASTLEVTKGHERLYMTSTEPSPATHPAPPSLMTK